MKIATRPTCIHGYEPSECTSTDHPAPASQETPAQQTWIKVAHILHVSAHCNLSWDTCKLLAQRIAKECIVNRDPAFQKLVKTLDDLCGFLNVTPLRLNEGDSITLSMLTDSAREALRLAREGEGLTNAG